MDNIVYEGILKVPHHEFRARAYYTNYMINQFLPEEDIIHKRLKRQLLQYLWDVGEFEINEVPMPELPDIG
jgi:hypothetical protein